MEKDMSDYWFISETILKEFIDKNIYKNSKKEINSIEL